MARPPKQTVDYFPHQCTSGKTLYILETEYGNDGYAFWFKLLEMLGSSEGHYYKYDNPKAWQFLLAKTKVDSDKAMRILNTLSDLDAIDPELSKHKVVWCQNLVNNVASVYQRRRLPLPEKPNCAGRKE